MTPRTPAAPRRVLRRAGAALALLALPLTSVADPPPPAPVAAPIPADVDLPLPLAERPFLLLDAPRRYSPREPAEVRVQRRGGGAVDLAVLRVADPLALLAGGPARQGVATAATPLGAELEALLAQTGPLPRRGAALTLVATRRVALHPPRRAARHTGVGESVAYDSNESDEGEVETWGVSAGEWSEQLVPLGALPAGLYLVRANAGAWASSALLSVGELVLLARRGDAHDALLATDSEGRPQAGVELVALEGAAVRVRARTGADGEARVPASEAPALRFVARRGDDVAWADVSHARLAPCDVRVYLATGRPVFRPGEPVHVRGHVRGCAGAPGGSRALRDEPVVLAPTRVDGAGETTVRTDADGNFTAVLAATAAGVRATVRGREHRRTLQLDARALPRHALRVTLDRPWAAVGDTVHVRVADDEGGWPTPASVEIATPAGRQTLPIGPGRAAETDYTVPAGTRATLDRATIHAALTQRGTTTYAQADVWIGRRRELLELASAQTVAAPESPLAVTLRATDLGGAPAPGDAVLTVRATDGNNPSGPPRWTGRVAVGASGQAHATVTLAGAGPWWIEARRVQPPGADSDRDAPTSSLVVWERARPPALSNRGALAVQPAVLRTAPGAPLAVDLRAPASPGGATWLTLEQGSVWSSALLAARGADTARVALAVPESARGLASLVATHVRGGQVSTASAVAEVETSRALRLALETDKRVYAGGETAHVTVLSRTPDGAPRDAVLSLWLADAGYWDLGTEDYPAPDDVFRLPGRRASAGDSTRPLGYGAEEGRRLDTLLEWNGRALPRTSFRHAWGHGGELVTFDARGSLDVIAQTLAARAGLSHAEVCRARVGPVGAATVRVRNLPWDLVALRLAEATQTHAAVRHGALVFSCDEVAALGNVGTIGHGSGSGSGLGGGGASGAREQTLEGTLLFIGTRRIGPTGRLELDVPLPDHPGRWRIETLAIADDGGGDRANATVSTMRPLEARVDVPARLRVGDATEGELSVYAPAHRGAEAAIALALPRGLTATAPLPTRVRVGPDGYARAPLALRATGAGRHAVTLEARIGAQSDRVQRTLEVAEDVAVQPLSVRTLLGPAATAVDVPLPELAAPATIRVRVDPGLSEGIDEALAELREPRWDVPALRIDRLASLRALEAAVLALPPEARGERAAQVARAVASETAAIASLRVSDGGVGWWTGLRSSTRLTAELLWTLGSASAGEASWRDARDVLRRRVRGVPERRDAAATAEDPEALLAAAAVLARDGDDADRALALALARRVTAPGARESASTPLEEAAWTLRAARVLRDPELLRAAVGRARAAIAAVVDGAQDPTAATCRGVAWFLCFSRLGDRAALARAAYELLEAHFAPDTRELATRAAAWLAAHVVETPRVVWGTAEADVMALTARVGAPRSADTRFEVSAGGRVIARGDARAPAVVVVPAGAPLRVSFAAAPGRVTRVRVEGELRVAPRAEAAGPVPLTRQIVASAGGARELLVEFAPARAAEDLEIHVPLPAGLELAVRSGDASGVRVRDDSVADWIARWTELDRGPGESRPVLERTDGGVVIRFARARAGHHALRVPLVALAPGRYRAGPAYLRARDASHWAVTPVIEADVRSEPPPASAPAVATARH